MKTTVQISDALLAEVQAIAAKNKTTLRALVQEGLQHVVSEDHKNKKPFKLKDMSVGGEGLRSELQNASWEEIRALIYEGRGA